MSTNHTLKLNPTPDNWIEIAKNGLWEPQPALCPEPTHITHTHHPQFTGYGFYGAALNSVLNCRYRACQGWSYSLHYPPFLLLDLRSDLTYCCCTAIATCTDIATMHSHTAIHRLTHPTLSQHSDVIVQSERRPLHVLLWTWIASYLAI